MWKSKFLLVLALLSLAASSRVEADHAIVTPAPFCAPEVCNPGPWRQPAPMFFVYQPMRRFWVIIRWGNQWLFYPSVQPAFPSVAVVARPGALPLSYY